jgi:methylated-DNA-[protein]-cysteine S-methyltransferase
MLETYSARLSAPFAVLGVRTSGERLEAIEYLPLGVATLGPLDAFAREVCRQLGAYLRDPAFRFDLPVAMRGTPFQREVWSVVRSIPAGRTMSYGEVAKHAHSAARPVGMACGANRLPLVIPCHRVVASQGIGGFMHSRAGRGIDVKRWLLRHEGVAV